MNRITKFSLILGLFIAFSQVQAADQLYDFDGKSRSISDFTGNGKWTVVMMWASDCHVCNAEAHAYNDFHEWHNDKDAVVLGISLDGQKKKSEAMGFIKKHSLSFTNLIGEPESIAKMYSELTGSPWVGTPTFMVYAPDGKILGAQVGAVPTDVIEGFIKRNAHKYSDATAASVSTKK